MTFKPVDSAITMVVGPCIDDGDFKTLEEAITYNAAGMDVSLIVEKTDGTTAVTAITLTTGGTSDWTHKDGGYYEIEITAGQNTEEGSAYIRGICTGVLPFESAHYNIVKANVYDSLVKGTDNLDINVISQANIDFGSVQKASINAECDTANTDYGANTTTPPTVVAIRTEMDANSAKMAPSQTLADYKATGFSMPNEYDSVLSAIRGAPFNSSTDSLKAIRSRGDSAWLTGAGGSSPTVGEIRTEMETTGSKLSLALIDTDELQGNQSNWLTAAGFSVPNEYDTVIADIPTVAELNARTILAANYFDPAADTVANVTTVATNTDMVGTDNAALATALTTHDNKLDAVDALVDRILTATEIRQSSVNDAAATTTKFITALTETDNDYWNRMALLFTSGNNSGQIRRIKDYVGATKEVTLQTPLNAAPTNSDTFVILTIRAFITPDIDDIADAVLDELLSEHIGAGSLSANITTIAAFNNLSATEVNTEVKDVMTVDTIDDSYVVDGNQPTITQAILAIQQMMQEKSITGTTLSVKKPDGSTTAMTFTLDSATIPTSITRAT